MKLEQMLLLSQKEYATLNVESNHFKLVASVILYLSNKLYILIKFAISTDYIEHHCTKSQAGFSKIN